MNLAERFNPPILTFRHSWCIPWYGRRRKRPKKAIAKNILVMSRLSVPILSVVVGEGGSGGLLLLEFLIKLYDGVFYVQRYFTRRLRFYFVERWQPNRPCHANLLGLTAEVALKIKLLMGLLKNL